jgi:hypothetical protein
MEVIGSQTFRAPAERLRALLLNPDLLVAAIPGCERLIQFGSPDADGVTRLEARVRSGEPAALRIVQIALRPDADAQTVAADLRWHEDAGKSLTREASAELQLDAQDGETTGAWTFHAEPAPDGLTEDTVRSFADTLCANLNATLERQGQPPAYGEISFGNELFVRTPYGTITMQRPESVWGGWVRTALLIGGVAVAVSGVVALAVTITRALSGRRHAQD